MEGAATAADGPCCRNHCGNPGKQDLGAGVLPPTSYIFFWGVGLSAVTGRQTHFPQPGAGLDSPSPEGDGQPPPANHLQ